MKDLRSWEKQMQTWTPREPSPRVARRLFGVAETPPLGGLRRGVLWLTPLAACCLTIMLTVGGLNHGGTADLPQDDGVYYASLQGGAASPAQLVRIRQSDDNVQWNVCPRLTPHVAAVQAVAPAPASSAAAQPGVGSQTNLVR